MSLVFVVKNVYTINIEYTVKVAKINDEGMVNSLNVNFMYTQGHSIKHFFRSQITTQSAALHSNICAW